MKEYHKIQTVLKRDPENLKRVIEGAWAMDEFDFLQNNEWLFTEKVDGTNIRVQYQLNGKPESVTFAGKTDAAQIPVHLQECLMDLFYDNRSGAMLDMLNDTFGTDGSIQVCFYGEGYGMKIQKAGKLYRPDSVGFVLFDVQVGDWWLRRHDVEDVADKLGLETVPVIGVGTLHDMVDKVRTGFKSKWGDFFAEGIVAQPTVPLFSRKGERIITKLKFKDFPQV